jgi:hypothetical protein
MIRVRDLGAAEDARKSGAPAKADALRISGVEQIASSLVPEPLRKPIAEGHIILSFSC